MYLRANQVSVEPGRVDELIRYVQEQVLPVVNEQDGSRGLAMGADRESGRCTIVSFWDDLDSLQASESRIGASRDEARTRYGATFDVTVAEIIEMHIRQQPQPGCWNRVSMLDLAPDDIDAATEAFRASTLPALEAMDGFCAAMLCADRPGGRAVAVTTWRDHDALRASTERANTLRQEVRDKAHAEIAAVMELEVVISQVRPS